MLNYFIKNLIHISVI